MSVVNINNRPINTTNEYRYLGITVDPALYLSNHFSKVYSKASGRLRLLQRLRAPLTVYSANRVYQSLIIPIITYCAVANLHMTESQKNHLQSITNRAQHKVSMNDRSRNVHIVDVYNRIKYRSCYLVAEMHSGKYEHFKEYFITFENATRNKRKVVTPSTLETGSRQTVF